MRNLKSILLLAIMCALPSFAGSKQKGTATLKDLQPTGTTDKKDHKNQQYDISFVVSGNQYTCRTNDKLNATAFVVGTDVGYELDSDKAKLKSASGKEAKCKVVRVEKLPDTPK
jgi:viroplasmin and RNaseH domain-containing protein